MLPPFLLGGMAMSEKIVNITDIASKIRQAKIVEKMNEAKEDETPYIIQKDDLTVVGDANRTEVKKNDYVIKYRIPREDYPEDIEGAKQIANLQIFEETYADISISPRNDIKIVNAVTKVVPFFRELKDDGTITDAKNEVILDKLANAPDEVILAIYNLVATFLGIDDFMGQYMLPFSVIDALSDMMTNHPEIFNEADAFFG